MFVTTVTNNIINRHLHDVLKFGALDIRDVDNGEEPFYTHQVFMDRGMLTSKD